MSPNFHNGWHWDMLHVMWDWRHYLLRHGCHDAVSLHSHDRPQSCVSMMLGCTKGLSIAMAGVVKGFKEQFSCHHSLLQSSSDGYILKQTSVSEMRINRNTPGPGRGLPSPVPAARRYVSQRQHSPAQRPHSQSFSSASWRLPVTSREPENPDASNLHSTCSSTWPYLWYPFLPLVLPIPVLPITRLTSPHCINPFRKRNTRPALHVYDLYLYNLYLYNLSHILIFSKVSKEDIFFMLVLFYFFLHLNLKKCPNNSEFLPQMWMFYWFINHLPLPPPPPPNNPFYI